MTEVTPFDVVAPLQSLVQEYVDYFNKTLLMIEELTKEERTLLSTQKTQTTKGKSKILNVKSNYKDHVKKNIDFVSTMLKAPDPDVLEKNLEKQKIVIQQGIAGVQRTEQILGLWEKQKQDIVQRVVEKFNLPRDLTKSFSLTKEELQDIYDHLNHPSITVDNSTGLFRLDPKELLERYSGLKLIYNEQGSLLSSNSSNEDNVMPLIQNLHLFDQ